MLRTFFTFKIRPAFVVLNLLVLFHLQGIAQTKKAENPLTYKLNQPINFSSVTAAHIADASQQAISNSKAALQRMYSIPAGKHTFSNTILALDDFSDQLGAVSSSLSILSQVLAYCQTPVQIRDCETRQNGI